MSKLTDSRGDKTFDIINYIFLGIVFICVAYPLYFILIASISNPQYVLNGQVWLYPKGVTFAGYKRVLEESRVWLGYKNSIIYTVVGVLISLGFTLPAAYSLSRQDLPGRNAITFFAIFTMFV